MKIRYVDTEDGLAGLSAALRGVSRFALDCEAAGYHRYSDRLCLLQLTVGDETFLVDPLVVDPADALAGPLQDPDVQVVMHGADFDVRLLHRDLGIGLRGLYDTQIVASLLGVQQLGLSSLLDEHFGVMLSKKYQKADWARRPIPQPMREYAAYDTHHLLELADRLDEPLRAKGRGDWAEEEFRELEKVRFDHSDDEDPVRRVKAARSLSDREVARLREALAWRDEIARARDRASFRVAGDPVLVAAATENPGSVSELANMRGMNGDLARSEGGDLLARFREVDAAGESEIEGYPRAPRGEAQGRGRPSPEAEELFQRIRGIRNRVADELGLAKGSLISNSVMQEIAESPPATPEELLGREGVRRWHLEVLGDELMEVLGQAVPTSG